MRNSVDKRKNIAVRSDSIIEARFALTSRQNNILDMLFTEIQNDDAYQYELSVDKYKHLYHIDTSNLYRDLKKATKTFEGLGFTIIDKDSKEEIFYVWFSKIHYIPKEGKIKVNVDPDLKKLLYEVKKKIYYDIEYTLNFSSTYSQRLYYYLKSYEDTKWRKDTIDDLLVKLNCPKTYENFANFKKYVLEVAKSEINAMSDILFDYEASKTGKKFTHIKFTIKKKADVKNPVMNEVAMDLIIEDIDYEFVNSMMSEPVSEEDAKKLIYSCRKGFDSQTVEDNIRRYYISKFKIAKEYFDKNEGNGSFIAILISSLKENWNTNSKKSNYKKKSVKNNNTSSNKQLRFDNFTGRGAEYYASLEDKLLGYS